jgi:DNA recombination protein RmuC
MTSQKISRRFSQIERVELRDNPNDLLEFEDSLLEQKDEHDD